MSTTVKTATMFLLAAFVLFVTVDLADAARRGGGGGRSMSRGGPASSGSFNRSQARPQRSQQRPSNVQRPQNSSRDRQRPDSRQDTSSQRQDNRQDRNDNRQDNQQDRNDNRQDRFDQRQENVGDRQDFRKEVHNDRKEWYEDRWRRGRYVSVASWGRMGCRNIVYVNGRRYYDCGGVRYERVYRGSEVTYIIVN